MTVYLDHHHAVAVILGVRDFRNRAVAAHFARRFVSKALGPWFVLGARPPRTSTRFASA